MRRYEILPHTADLRLKVEGDSLLELFLAAVEGMNSVIKKDFCEKIANSKTTADLAMDFKMRDKDITLLLIDFLSTILLASHDEKAVYCNVYFDRFEEIESEWYITTTVGGCLVDGFDEDIKAVTYHEASIIKNAQGNYETTIVFDI